MSPYFMTYMEHPMFPWSQNQHLSYSESEIASRILLLQHARKLISENSGEAKAASKQAYDIKTKARKIGSRRRRVVALPRPTKVANYTPWRGIYTIVEKTSHLIYKLRKKGGRIKTAHINHIKYYAQKIRIRTKTPVSVTKKMKKPKHNQHNPRDLRPIAETIHYPHQSIDLPQ